MLTTIRQLHRMLVDRMAERLPGRAGPERSWAHYEHHARASARTHHLHARAGNRAERLAQRGAPRVLTSWQDRIARLTKTGRPSK
jgi:hypothetical protein